jgi:acyl-CoA synthetase (NDP forming)
VHLDDKRAASAHKILAGAPSGLLPEGKTNALLKLYHLPLPHGEVVGTPAEALKAAAKVGYPVTAKISSKDIIHKTDIGGVRVNIGSDRELKVAYEEILASVRKKAPRAHIDGILIQQSLPPGNEFIAGALRDPSVGHLVMAGLGGIYTELFKDAVFRVAPVSVPDVYLMLPELKSWKLLLGMRGKSQLDIDAFAELISSLSILVTECPEIKEVDFNPVLVTEKGITILDAKVVLG